MKLKINKVFSDYNGIDLYNISNENYLNLDTSYDSLNFNYSNGNISQQFYLSLVSYSIFRSYILRIFQYCNESKMKINLKYEHILDYYLDGFRNLTILSIDKNTKFISDNAFKNINTLKKIKINFEWLHKFNKKNITSIEFNDNISQLNLRELKDFVNLDELILPLGINSILGSYNLYIPKLRKLECDSKLLLYFKEISLEKYSIHREIKIIDFKPNFYPFAVIKADYLHLFNNLKRIQNGVFDYSFFKQIFCCIHHVKYLNKNIVSIIALLDENIDTIYSNTFENFINLKYVILPKNIKKIESKGFNNCRNLENIELPDNCTDIRWDSFFKCDKIKIVCKDEIKEKLKRTVSLSNKKFLTKGDLKNYTSIESLEIEFDTQVLDNAFNNLTNLKMLICGPDALNKLPLNRYKENNLKILIFQNGTKKIRKEMIKYCTNLEFISIPLSVESIEEGTFDSCKDLRIIECEPIFLKYFTSQYITTLLIQEGVQRIYKKDFTNIKYIQNLFIPKSVKYIEEGAFYHLKAILILRCEQKWKSYKYFPFKYIIEDGTKFIDPEIFKGWYNLRTLIIPKSVTTILPFTFAHCQGIKNLKCSPDYFKFLNVKNVKVLILPEGVEKLNKDDLKGFLNLIYLKLPNSIKTIDEDTFDEVPCLNYDNISDHPIIREIKRKKYEKISNIKKKKI